MPIPHSRDMEPEYPNLRSVTDDEESTAPDGGLEPAESFGVDETSELVADLIGATGLVPADRLALVRGRAQQSSFSEAIAAEGLASSEGVARMLAARHGLPLVDLRLAGVAGEAVGLIPLHVLRRAEALPYRLDENTLFVAIADPQNVHAIDELRLATRHQLALGVAPRDEIVTELDRIGRVSHAVVESLEQDNEFDTHADLEEEDGVTEGPVVRIVNSVILQAAEDGASDLHFEAQEDGLVVRFRIDGVLHEVQRIPRRLAAGVT